MLILTISSQITSEFNACLRILNSGWILLAFSSDSKILTYLLNVLLPIESFLAHRP